MLSPSVPEPPSTLFPAMKGGKYGYIDASGKMRIPPSFDHAFAFHEGYALVHGDREIVILGEDGVQTAIDTSDAPQGLRYEGNFRDGLVPMRAEKGGPRMGFVDTKGRWVVPPKYAKVQEFREGRAMFAREHPASSCSESEHLMYG